MRTTLASRCAPLVASVLSLLVLVAPAVAGRDTLTLVSIDSAGAQGSSSSLEASISVGGRYVAFSSDASNLVAGDTNRVSDIFVHDRATGATARVSVGSAGEQANGHSSDPSISADGRYVAFLSGASNLVAGDTNAGGDIFVHDRTTGATARVSVDSEGAQANSSSVQPSISVNGRYVAFSSDASNLVPGDTNRVYDVFVRDLVLGTTTRASIDSAGREDRAGSFSPSLSADGRYVAFSSYAFGTDDTNQAYDIFVRDLYAGTITRISVDSAGGQANGSSFHPAISGNGRYVAFSSEASNLVAGDTNRVADVFVHDRATAATTRASVDSAGAQSDDRSFRVSISADGGQVAFLSDADNLVDEDTNRAADVFVREIASGTTWRVSVNSNGAQANSSSIDASISSDGSRIAFSSFATNFVLGDANDASDVFVQDMRGASGR